MANIVRDPKEHPDAIIPDLAKAELAIVKFKKEDIALVYGSLWKQRYFTKNGNDYFAEPAQWECQKRSLAAVFCGEQHRLVGEAPPARQHEAPDRRSLRRLSFRELQHHDQDSHRVECRL